MDTELEPDWLRPLREALMAAVTVVRDGANELRLESALGEARERGWEPNDESCDDLWRTARIIAEMTGSKRQFPVNAFVQREVERMSAKAI